MIPVHEFYLTDDLGNRYLESGKFELQVGTSSDRIYFNLPVYIGSSGKGGQTVSGTFFQITDRWKSDSSKRNCP